MLTCQQYDYIEIACMYRYPVKLVARNGEEISGTAIDTERNEHKQECIRIDTEGQSTLVVLDSLSKMEVLTANPNFQQVFFSN